MRGARLETFREANRQRPDWKQAPYAFPGLGLYSYLGLNIEPYLVTRSKGNTLCLVGRNPAPGER